MPDFSIWWDALSLIEKIYWIVAIPSSLILLIQLAITFIFGDFDSDADMDSHFGDHGDMGFHIFTFKNVLGFFTIFSWTGLGFLKIGIGIFFTLIFSFIAGFIMMLLMAFIFLKISQLNQSGTMLINNALDKTCEVYLTIPEDRKGRGKVFINIQGSLHELEAITDDVEPIPTGSTVLVLEVLNDEILLVTKLNY